MADIQCIRTVSRLRHSPARDEVLHNVPVVDFRIWTDSSSHQFPQDHTVRPLNNRYHEYTAQAVIIKHIGFGEIQIRP